MHLHILRYGTNFVGCFFVAEMRLRNFVAGLTNTNPSNTAPVYKQYRHVQYSGTVGPGATVSVSFDPSTEVFRYVIIQNQFRFLCLREVKVFLRMSGIFLFCYAE